MTTTIDIISQAANVGQFSYVYNMSMFVLRAAASSIYACGHSMIFPHPPHFHFSIKSL